MRSTWEGPCENCEPSDVSVVFVVCLIATLSLLGVYWAIVNENRAKNNDHVVIFTTLVSQLVTVLQMMGVCNLLSVAWPQPFSSILSFASILNLKLEVLNVGCVVGMKVATRYAATALGFVVLLVVMCVLHFSHMILFHFREMLSGKWKKFRPAFVGGLGSIMMLCYISVVATICAPLRCEGHPNGESTAVKYPQVVCWSSSDHRRMLLVGAAATCIPVGFLSMVCVVLRLLPKYLAKGEMGFLRAFSFLFFRFRPGTFWYASVLLVRNDETLQLFVLVVILLPCTVISAVILPWRAKLASLCDVTTNGSFVLVVFLGALFKNVDDKSLIGDVLMAICVIFASVFLIGVFQTVNMFYTRRRRKCYEFFLCHHKDGAGAFCRWLKMFLQDGSKRGAQIFLDSDNLQDLFGLFGTVANSVRTLVVLCSKEILQRPWCVGEMCTARENTIDTIMVCFHNVVWPSDLFIDRYAEHVKGIHALASYGIGLDIVRETLHWLRTRPRVVLPRRTTLSSMQSVADRLVKRRGGNMEQVSVGGMRTVYVGDCLSVVENPGFELRASVFEHRVQHEAPHVPVPKGSMVVSIVDHANDEAVCAAFIIERLLRVHFPLGTQAPHMLASSDHIPTGVTAELVICSNGCFQQAQVVRHLLQAHAMGVRVLPVYRGVRFPLPYRGPVPGSSSKGLRHRFRRWREDRQRLQPVV